MKLIFFIFSLGAGGAERVTATLANYWSGKGWQVCIVTITGIESDFYELDPRIERVVLELDRASANPIAALSNNIRRLIALGRVLKRIRPDVAVSMMTTANALLALTGHGLSVPAIGSERIHPPMLPMSRAWKVVRRWSYPKLSALVAQTEQSADWLKCHAPAPRIAVIPNPVNYPLGSSEPRVSPVSTRKDTGAQRILLAAGRLEEQKGFDLLIKAFSVLSPDYPEWILVILGEGKQRAQLSQKVICLNIADKVCMPGAVGNVGEWFDGADLYVLTSRFEGFPNTLLEALAYGLPAIAVDCETGPRDILRHEVDGLLVPQEDESALVCALKRLMADASLRRLFSKRAVEVRHRFALDRVAGMWEALFCEVAR